MLTYGGARVIGGASSDPAMTAGTIPQLRERPRHKAAFPDPG